ncbi:hypothetical protein ABK040_008128 [Willaertia magna]
MSDPLKNAVCFIPDRLYWMSMRRMPLSFDTATIHYVTVDDKFVYEPFYNDFGPLNLGNTIAFCRLIEGKLQSVSLSNKKLVIITSFDGGKRANAAYLICAFMIIVLGYDPEDAFKPFLNIYPPFHPFRDASQSLSTFNLTVLDCCKALKKAISLGFLHYSLFNTEDYFHYEKVENGDMNWIVPGKFLAFSSPANRRITGDGLVHFTPEDYLPLFKKWNITAIVRLNKQLYDKKKFTANGIRHFDMYFPDGSIPSDEIVKKFLSICDTEKGAIAVHCKAGLGRTGTLIGLNLMRRYRFTATEVIAWLRICRPGSVIGIQQHFLDEKEFKMWKDGEEFTPAIIDTNPQLIIAPSSPVQTSPSVTISTKPTINTTKEIEQKLTALKIGTNFEEEKKEIISTKPITTNIPESNFKDTPILPIQVKYTKRQNRENKFPSNDKNRPISTSVVSRKPEGKTSVDSRSLTPPRNLYKQNHYEYNTGSSLNLGSKPNHPTKKMQHLEELNNKYNNNPRDNFLLKENKIISPITTKRPITSKQLK